jgi:phosphorylated CTD-interacting factor 1
MYKKTRLRPATMAKPTGRKRRRSNTQNEDLLCNVTGLHHTSLRHDETMEVCMAELECAQEQDAAPAEKVATYTSAQARPTHHNSSSSWIQAFQTWVITGKYTGGLPNPQLEVSRHFQTQELSSFLLAKCPPLRMPAFERWWIDSKWEECYQQDRLKEDPLIPCRPSLETEASQRLLEEIVHSSETMTEDDAQRIVHDLCLKTKHTTQELAQMSSRKLAPLGKGAHIELEKNSSQCTLRYTRKSWKKPFCVQVNTLHYDKLWEAFVRVHPSLKREKHTLQSFHVLIFCLLLRYSSLSGGHLLNDLRGGGMQGAIHPEVFEVLQRFFPSQPIMECFASPWNAHMPDFTSAFQDLDAHFGSLGDFRHYHFREGVFQANPPFSPGLMMDMAKRMEECLTVATREKKRLTFFVIVPTANVREDAVPPPKRHAEESFSTMRSSTHCRLHVVLPSREHGYVEGAQHLRPTRYKQSPYDTSLILLQSEAAQQGLDTKSFEKKLRKAFASRHEEELKQRQEKR